MNKKTNKLKYFISRYRRHLILFICLPLFSFVNTRNEIIFEYFNEDIVIRFYENRKYEIFSEHSIGYGTYDYTYDSLGIIFFPKTYDFSKTPCLKFKSSEEATKKQKVLILNKNHLDFWFRTSAQWHGVKNDTMIDYCNELEFYSPEMGNQRAKIDSNKNVVEILPRIKCCETGCRSFKSFPSEKTYSILRNDTLIFSQNGTLYILRKK